MTEANTFISEGEDCGLVSECFLTRLGKPLLPPRQEADVQDVISIGWKAVYRKF